MPDKNTEEYINPYKTDNDKTKTRTVLKISNKYVNNYIQTFLEDFFIKEQGRSGGIVRENSYEDIKKNINKIINRNMVFNTTYNRFEERSYNAVDYDFENFKDVNKMVQQLIDSIQRHIQNYSRLGDIMDAVINEYFDPTATTTTTPIVKTGLFSRLGFK